MSRPTTVHRNHSSPPMGTAPLSLGLTLACSPHPSPSVSVRYRLPSRFQLSGLHLRPARLTRRARGTHCRLRFQFSTFILTCVFSISKAYNIAHSGLTPPTGGRTPASDSSPSLKTTSVTVCPGYGCMHCTSTRCYSIHDTLHHRGAREAEYHL